jgi:hypothetical protein
MLTAVVARDLIADEYDDELDEDEILHLAAHVGAKVGRAKSYILYGARH